MSDRLNEAIRTHDSWRKSIEKRYPEAFNDGVLGVQVTLVEAARAYADLLANGERMKWCETHYLPRGMHVYINTCRIVSKLLIDPPKEEE